jgi:hypothetical protein
LIINAEVFEKLVSSKTLTEPAIVVSYKAIVVVPLTPNPSNTFRKLIFSKYNVGAE